MLNIAECVEELENEGFTTRQANTSVKVWIRLMNENLTSKNDLNLAVLKMDGEFEKVHHQIELMEHKLTNKLGKIIIGSATVLGVILGLLIKL